MYKKIIAIILTVCSIFSIYTLSSQPSKASNDLSEKIAKTVVEILPSTKKLPASKKSSLILKTNIALRDIAHIVVFFILSITLICSLKLFKIKKAILISIIICVLYSVFDEIYQELFSSGRGFEIVDLLKDWFGIFMGVIIIANIIIAQSNKKNPVI